MPQPSIDFRQIRPYGSPASEADAFEELSCQLVEADFPQGTKSYRTGVQDGGKELLAEFPDQSKRGWQAKAVSQLDPSAIGQMTGSFETAVTNHPDLSHYEFCIPFDLPDARVVGRESAREKWEKQKTLWEKWAKDQGSDVEVSYLGKHELVTKLQEPRHAGLVRYWFDKTILTPEWFDARFEEARLAAGARYTPKLHFDLDIAEVFDGIGLTADYIARLHGRLADLRKARRYTLRSHSLSDADSDLANAVDGANAALTEFDVSVAAFTFAEDTPSLSELRARGEEAASALDEVVAPLRDRLRARTEGDQSDAQKRAARALRQEREEFVGEAREVGWELARVQALLNAPASELVDLPALLVTGAAGAGKTHLLCDAAERRTKQAIPTVVLLGHKFQTTQNPWTQIRDQLQVDCSTDEFLDAVDEAARVAGGRGLIVVDALNEGKGLALWPNYLREFVGAIRARPHLGVIVSCRYNARKGLALDSFSSSELVEVRHDGFRGVEYAAAQHFFEHYGLAMPDFPLLIPEFQRPLFLKLACETLSSQGKTSLPREAAAVSWLFEAVLAETNKRLAQPEKCDYDEDRQLVQKALARIAEAMIGAATESLSQEEAEKITQALLPKQGWGSSLLNGLLDEDVLAKDTWNDGDPTIRFLYQRFGDHLRAEAMLASATDQDKAAEVVRDLTAGRNGFTRNVDLLEALAIQLPERFGIEIINAFAGAEVEHYEFQILRDAFLSSLIWRQPDAVDLDKVLPFLRQIAAGSDWDRREFVSALLQVSALPDHPLNADYLHRVLSDERLSLARRDDFWTTNLWWDADNGSAEIRLVEWALSGETAYSEDDAILLAATAIAWLLTSSNRMIRDRATKAIVALLRDRIHLMTELVTRFADVNDPYVTQRIYGAAYGCALASRAHGVKDLAKAVWDRVFAGSAPPADFLLRDYARGVMERASVLGVLPAEVDLDTARPPYSSNELVVPDDDEDKLREAYPLEEYASLYNVFGLGDFRRYVIEPAIRQFEGVSTPQAAEWVFERVIELGWDPQLFKDYDRDVRSIGRQDGPRERIGKKYQRIAFAELLARITDHRAYRKDRWERTDEYQGPWNLGDRDIDVSMTLSGTLAEHWTTTPSSWWLPDTPRLPDQPTREARNAWLRDADDLPAIPNLLRVTDSADRNWYVLESHPHWQQERAVLDERDDRAELWLQIRAYLVRKADVESVKAWAAKQNWGGRWMLEGDEPRQVFTGEFPWHHAAEDYRGEWHLGDSFATALADDESVPNDSGGHESAEPETDGGQSDSGPPSASEGTRDLESNKAAPGRLLAASANYHWEGDYAMHGAMTALLPCADIIDGLDLRWDGRGFGYLNAQGELAVQYPAVNEPGPSTVLIAEDDLRRFLDQKELGLIWTVLGEKRVLHDPTTTREDPEGELNVSGSYARDELGSIEEISLDVSFLDYAEMRAEQERERHEPHARSAAVRPESRDDVRGLLQALLEKGGGDAVSEGPVDQGRPSESDQ